MTKHKEEKTSVNLLEVLLLVVRYKKRFFGIIISITLVALIASLVWPKTYKSSFTFVQYNNTPEGSLGGVINNLVQLSSSSSRVSTDQAIIILQSRSMQDQVINKFNLREVYGSEINEELRKKLSNNVEIEESREGGIGFSPIVSVDVNVYDEEPDRAKAMAEFYMEKLDSSMVDINRQNAEYLMNTYEEKFNENLNDLREAEEALVEFQEEYGILEVESQLKVMIENLGQLKAQIVEVEIQKNFARSNFGENSSQYRQLESQQQELQKVYDQRLGTSDKIMKEEVQETEVLFPELLEVPSLGVRYYRLFRNLTVQEEIYKLIYPQYEQQRMLFENVNSGLKLIDEPHLPTYKDSPKRAFIVIAGFLLSIFIAFLTVFFVEFKRKGQEENTEGYQLYNEIKSELTKK